MVGAGAALEPLPGFASGEGIEQVDYPIGIPAGRKLEAWKVSGISMLPIDEGSLVFVESGEAFPGPHLFGRVCLVETASGDKYLKRVERGYKSGCYNLRSWNGGQVMQDVALRKAAPIIAMIPPPMPAPRRGGGYKGRGE
jgi:hypothetical protein